MVDEVISYINKKVAITLINGKERNGTIIGIDIESNSIKLKDENGSQASLLISMIGMLEPFTILNGNGNKVSQTSPINEQAKSISSNGSNQKSQETVQKVTKLEILYETEIRNAIITVSKPNFEMPADIKKITYTAIEDFIPADNKYATYAESAEVKEDDMFFGRENIINNIYNVVCNNYKSFVFYGQKRAGKSSILYHLEKRLKNNSNVRSVGVFLKPLQLLPTPKNATLVRFFKTDTYYKMRLRRA